VLKTFARPALYKKRWWLFTGAVILLLLIFAPPALAPDRTLPGENLSRTSQLVLEGEIDQTGFIKGFYLSYPSMGSADFMARAYELIEETELNAVVLDFKGDDGLLSFPTQVALASEIGAGRSPVVRNPAEFLGWFKQRNVYLIARIVVFKDDKLANAYPSWAITDTATGGVWHDQEGKGWLDPNRKAVWDYATALALEAAALGFDEIQFDYIRFPTDGNVQQARYALPNTYENRVAAISGVLQQASSALRPLGVKIGADVFGYIPWSSNDLGIGQHLETIAPYVDVLAPMIYPSTFAAGLPGEDSKYRTAVAYPYAIVSKTTERSLRRARETNPRIEVRPWLQDFRDYTFDLRTFTPAEIRLQIEGARDAGARGWLLWDPSVRYTRAALVSAQPAFLPNRLGRVPVLAYNQVDPAVLRSDLEWLLQEGFYPATVADLAQRHLNGVPAGKKAVVLTFDGSPLSQFRLLEGGRVDSDCAVGVLLAFAAAHPADFPARGTFFVRPDPLGSSDSIFGTANLASSKLQMLVNWGFEIGLQLSPEGLQGSATAGDLKSWLEQAEAQLAVLLPGYDLASLALTQDAPLPKGWLSTVSSGDAQDGFNAAVLPAGGLSLSPFTPRYAPDRISRLPAGALDEASWRQTLVSSDIFVSAGE